MANLKTKSNIIAFGDPSLFNNLFQKINDQFITNETYKNNLNKINIINSTCNNIYEMNITTKYYDIDLNVQVVCINELEKKLDEIFLLDKREYVLEGVFILVSQNSEFELLNTDSLVNYSKINDKCLNLLITDESNSNNDDNVDKFIEKNENFIEIKLNLTSHDILTENVEKNKNDDEEVEFTNLDELINLIFVQTWSNMKLNTEKATTKNIQANETDIQATSDDKVIQIEKEITEEDDNEFNFENLIMNLNEMKAKAGNLSFEERKKYAENVVKQFWQSMGGDESELADLDQDDD